MLIALCVFPHKEYLKVRADFNKIQDEDHAVGGNHNAKDGGLLGCCAISLVEVYRRFRSVCCLHHQGDE
jgi:hypothetical protein